MKVRISVEETYKVERIVDAPDDIPQDEIAEYVDQGISDGEYDINPTEGSEYDYDSRVHFIEEVR